MIFHDLKQHAGRTCFKYAVLISFCIFLAGFFLLADSCYNTFPNTTFLENTGFFASEQHLPFLLIHVNN